MRSAPVARAVPLLAAALLVLVAVLSGSARAVRLRAHHAASESVLRHELLRDLNAVRARHGLAPLRLSRELDAAAEAHTSEMLNRGYFSHSSANGSPYWRRIMGFYPAVPGASYSVGENLLWMPGDLAAARAVAMWMASPEHRQNILMPGWRQIGIAVERRRNAPGVFQGLPVTLFATDFGTRR